MRAAGVGVEQYIKYFHIIYKENIMFYLVIKICNVYFNYI